MIKHVFFIDTFTYTCLKPADTGLSCDIWLDSLGYTRRHSKQPYILIHHKLGWEKIYILKKPDPISYELRSWIESNRSIIVSHWNKEISDKEALNILSANSISRENE